MDHCWWLKNIRLDENEHTTLIWTAENRDELALVITNVQEETAHKGSETKALLYTSKKLFQTIAYQKELKYLALEVDLYILFLF